MRCRIVPLTRGPLPQIFLLGEELSPSRWHGCCRARQSGRWVHEPIPIGGGVSVPLHLGRGLAGPDGRMCHTRGPNAQTRGPTAQIFPLAQNSESLGGTGVGANRVVPCSILIPGRASGLKTWQVVRVSSENHHWGSICTAVLLGKCTNDGG